MSQETITTLQLFAGMMVVLIFFIELKGFADRRDEIGYEDFEPTDENIAKEMRRYGKSVHPDIAERWARGHLEEWHEMQQADIAQNEKSKIGFVVFFFVVIVLAIVLNSYLKTQVTVKPITWEEFFTGKK